MPMSFWVAALFAFFGLVFLANAGNGPNPTTDVFFGLGLLITGLTFGLLLELIELNGILRGDHKPKTIEDLDREAREIRSRRKGE